MFENALTLKRLQGQSPPGVFPKICYHKHIIISYMFHENFIETPHIVEKIYEDLKI